MPSTTTPEDDLDRRFIVATQAGLPLVPEPYAKLANELGIEESVLHARIQAMLDDGRIRRIGAVPNHYRLGYKANGMSVWDLADDDVDAAGELIGDLDFVSHCYRRPRRLPEWPYNLFAMLHAHNREEVRDQAEQIRSMLGTRIHSHDILFSTRILKKTGLRIGRG